MKSTVIQSMLGFKSKISSSHCPSIFVKKLIFLLITRSTTVPIEVSASPIASMPMDFKYSINIFSNTG